ncbi:MAG: arylesterase [Phyllobacteriaceae bacterium]|nr:arylesterase [Phyllobacteriaceae bacterium]
MGFKPFIAAMAVLLAFAGAVRAEPVEIVGLGDSLMAGYGLAPGEGFTDRLAAALAQSGVAVNVINAGVSGDTSSGGLERLDWSVSASADLVILELGANDMLRGIPPDVTRANLDQMIVKLKGRGVAVVLAGMRAAPSMGAEFQAEFDPIYPDLAAAHGVALYPFFLDGVAARPDLLLEDGLHPNAKGVQVMVERMLPSVKEAVAALN